MITAAGLADALAPALVELVQPGEDRPVLAVELVEPGVPVPIERGDVVVAVGARDVAEVVAVAESARAAAGLVLRRGWADHTDVRALCKDARLPLLAVADDATWSLGSTPATVMAASRNTTVATVYPIMVPRQIVR